MSALRPLPDPRPLYAQVEDHLKQELRSSRLSPGDRLPPEPELARLLGVSRQTVRQALGRLEAAGLVTRRPGRGTVVSRPPLEQPLGGALTLRQVASQAGLALTPVIDRISLVDAAASPRELSQALGPLLCLGRHYVLDGESIIALEWLWLDDPEVVAIRDLLESDPTASIYEFLRATGRCPQWSRESLQADSPTPAEQERLGSDHPVIRLRRVSGDLTRTHEIRQLVLRGDRIQLTSDWGTPLRGRDEA